ncbi:MAG: hypothetical protein ABI361_13235 [Nitrososphaera sp.]
MFGRKKKTGPASEAIPSEEDKFELEANNVDVEKLVSEIEKFLAKSDDPFDFNTYKIHRFPEKKLTLFEIDYGPRRPTTKFLVVLEGDNTHLRVLNRPPDNSVEYLLAIQFLSPLMASIFLPKALNAKKFYGKLWQTIENAIS